MKSRRPPLNPAVAAHLDVVRHEFKRWRQSRTNRSRIPENLWGVAAEVARECGVFRTSEELHLNYNALRDRINSKGSPLGRGDSAAAGFVEIVPSPAVRFSECTVEIERGKGTKIRIHLKSPETLDLGAIGSAFLRARL